MKQLICCDDSKSQYCGQNICKNCKNICWIVGDNYCNKKKTCPYSSFRSKICKNRLQKWNPREKLGKEHLDCKSQLWQPLIKVNSQSQHRSIACQRWHQLTWRVMSADVDNDVSRWRVSDDVTYSWRQLCRSGVWRHVKKVLGTRRRMKKVIGAWRRVEKFVGVWNSSGTDAESLGGAWGRVDAPVTLRLSLTCRSAEDDLSDTSRNAIGAI